MATYAQVAATVPFNHEMDSVFKEAMKAHIEKPKNFGSKYTASWSMIF